MSQCAACKGHGWRWVQCKRCLGTDPQCKGCNGLGEVQELCTTCRGAGYEQ